MKLSLIVLLAILGFGPRNADAFIFIRGSGYSKGARPVSAAPAWTGRKVRFYVNTDLLTYGTGVAPTLTSDEFYSAIQTAVNSWASACRADLRVQLGGSTSMTADSSDGVNVISYDSRAVPNTNFTSQSTLAYAVSALSGEEFFDCDILVNGDTGGTSFAITFAGGTTVGAAADYDLVSTITHEIGHCLGLDHPIELNPVAPQPVYSATAGSLLLDSTMLQTADLDSASLVIARRDIDQDDRDAVECVYERGRALRTGTTCTSYHGTNGGSAISGNQTGGPTSVESPVTCGSAGDGNTARFNFENTGTGCVTSAIANPGQTHKPVFFRETLGSVWGFLGSILGLYALKRSLSGWNRRRKKIA